MQAYGSKRTFGNCRTFRSKSAGKIHIQVFTKNRKRDRKLYNVKISKDAKESEP